MISPLVRPVVCAHGWKHAPTDPEETFDEHVVLSVSVLGEVSSPSLRRVISILNAVALFEVMSKRLMIYGG